MALGRASPFTHSVRGMLQIVTDVGQVSLQCLLMSCFEPAWRLGRLRSRRQPCNHGDGTFFATGTVTHASARDGRVWWRGIETRTGGHRTPAAPSVIRDDTGGFAPAYERGAAALRRSGRRMRRVRQHVRRFACAPTLAGLRDAAAEPRISRYGRLGAGAPLCAGRDSP